MRDRPILFNDEMVRAILEGRKTQTRRVIKPQPEQPAPGSYFDAYNGGPQWNWWAADNRQHLDQIIKCPFGKPGDRLWVRETFADEAGGTRNFPGEHIYYRADGDGVDLQGGCWKPSIHMPRWASRITLEITGVRVERLQEITLGDICKEGLASSIYDFKPVQAGFLAFEELWESIYGPDSWDANPWVWVIEFKRIEQEEQTA